MQSYVPYKYKNIWNKGTKAVPLPSKSHLSPDFQKKGKRNIFCIASDKIRIGNNNPMNIISIDTWSFYSSQVDFL